MTIGPAPMIRIEEMSVRLGMLSLAVTSFSGAGTRRNSIFTVGGHGFRARSLAARNDAQKKGAQPRVPLRPVGWALGLRPAGSLDEKRGPGKGCGRAPHRRHLG